jgi:hypothetical protein
VRHRSLAAAWAAVHSELNHRMVGPPLHVLSVDPSVDPALGQGLALGQDLALGLRPGLLQCGRGARPGVHGGRGAGAGEPAQPGLVLTPGADSSFPSQSPSRSR